jgi:protein CpxP
MFLNKKKSPALLLTLAFICLASSGTILRAQDWRGGDKDGPGGPGGPGGGPPMMRSFRGMERGRWWNNPRIAEQIGLTDDQKKKMDDIFQQHRLQLIDLSAAVEKQEAIMQPLIGADQPDEAKILSQIDAIAQARAELEKNRARMLFGIRQVLTADQWKKLKEVAHEGPPRTEGGQGRARGWSRGNGGPDGGNNAQQPPPPGGTPPQPPSE